MPKNGHSSFGRTSGIQRSSQKISEIIYYARVLGVTSCPAVPAACCQVYHKYFTKLNLGLREHCDVEGSTPSRVNGSSVVECTTKWKRPVKSAVRIRAKRMLMSCFRHILYPYGYKMRSRPDRTSSALRAIGLMPEGLGYRRMERGNNRMRKFYLTGNGPRAVPVQKKRCIPALPSDRLLNKTSALCR